MAITPSDLVELGARLASEPGEASLRAACSRAYYAAYHACLSFAEARGFKAERGSVHAALIRYLTEGAQKDARQLGNQLRIMRTLRTEADYYLGWSFESPRAAEAVEQARHILSRVAAP
jgi:uncharacterized protein (UPF0332 family)